MILIYVLGISLILVFFDFIRLDSNYLWSAFNIIISSLTSIFANFSKLFVGLWFFVMANKFQQDKWSWLLIGLAFGQYSVIFLVITLILQAVKLKTDITKTIRPVLIVVIISLLLSPISRFLINPYLIRILSETEYGIVKTYESYLLILNYGIFILINSVLASKLYKFIGQLQIKGRLLWTISTVFIGLFPVILFNGLIMTKTDNNNAA